MAKLTFREISETLGIAVYSRTTVAAGFPRPIEVLFMYEDGGRDCREVLATFATNAGPFMGQMIRFFRSQDPIVLCSRWESMKREMSRDIAYQREKEGLLIERAQQESYGPEAIEGILALFRIECQQFARELKRRWLRSAVLWIEEQNKEKARKKAELREVARLARRIALWEIYVSEVAPDNIGDSSYDHRIQRWEDQEADLRRESKRVYDPFDDDGDW